jgi:hypothetical protein
VDSVRYQQLFNEIMRKKHNMEVDFGTVELSLDRVRKGDALSYKDLEMMENEEFWPFKKYWMWPAKEQIERQLENTKGLFIDPAWKETADVKIIRELSAIFRNISLVSIVVRFVWPEYYAIYSRPPLKILRIERGSNDVEEYMNYIREMRLLRASFGVEETADVDIIVWTISQRKEEYREFMHLLAERLPENLTPGDLIRNLSDNPIKIAETYLKQGDYKTSGYWAARAFEVYLNEECRRLYGFIPRKEDAKKGEIEHLIDCLCEHPDYWGCGELMHRIRRLRNRAIHDVKLFEEKDAVEFIKGYQELSLSFRTLGPEHA